MTVTRYKKDRGADDIRKAVLGVMRHVPTKPAEEVVPAAEPAKPVERPAMRISDVAKARSRRRAVRRTAQDNLFKAYQPPPGVVPADQPTLAMDDALSTWANSSFGSAVETLGGFEEGLGFVGFAYLSQLCLRPEFRRISERLATEMTRKWVRMTIAGEAKPRAKKEEEDDAPVAGDAAIAPKQSDDDDADPELDDEDVDDVGPTPEEIAQRKRNDELQEKLKEIGDEMKRLDVRGKFKMVAEFDGWMGRSHLLIDTGDGDDPVKMESDLGNGSDLVSKETFKKGSLRGIKHIEPIWTYPQSYNANDPTADDFYNPQVWMVLGKRIHASRLLTFVGRPVPDILKPAFAFGGMSMSQMAKPYVDNWLRTRQAVTNLIESFSVSGVYTNAQSLLQGGGDDVFDRIELFNNVRSNAGTLVLDKETEEFFNITTPLGTLDQLQAQSQEQLSSVSGIPLIILLGISPHGLNASSEGELRTFYDLVLAFQEYLFRDKLHRVICFIQLNLYGEVDPAIGFEFEPLWSLDEKGEKEVKKIEAETHQLYLDMGVVGQDEVRKIVIADPDSPYNALDPDEMPEPPDQTGMIQGKSGGEGGEGEESDRAMDQAVDDYDGLSDDDRVVEIAPDIYLALDANWEESKHPRDHGKFATKEGGGAEPEDVLGALEGLLDSMGAGAKEVKTFKTKKDHIGHLLTKGTTAKEVMTAMGWPSVSMPNQAKQLGMKLEKYTEGGVTKYKGVPLTDKEKAALKAEQQATKAGKETDAAAQKILKNAGLDVPVKPAAKEPSQAPKDYEEFKQHLKSYQDNEEHQNITNLMKYNPSYAAKYIGEVVQAEKDKAAVEAMHAEIKAKEEAAKPTAEELKKAAKNTPVPISSGDPNAMEAVKAFNAKYAGKTDLTDAQLTKKIADYKELKQTIDKAAEAEKAAQAEAQKKAQAAAKIQAEQYAEKAKAEAAKSAEQNKEVIRKLGVTEEQATAFNQLVSLVEKASHGTTGSKDLIEKFKKYEKEAKEFNYPITGFEYALIRSYINGTYGAVNAALREKNLSPKHTLYVSIMNKAMAKMPKYTGTCERGTSLTPEQIANYIPGQIVTEHGFTSSGVNFKFDGNVTYSIKANGMRGCDFSKTTNKGEKEVLFLAHTSFLIHKVTKKGNGAHIEMEEI